MSTHNIYSFKEDRKENPQLFPFASWPGAKINPQWLELPMSKKNFHSPKEFRATELRLYTEIVLTRSDCVSGNKVIFQQILIKLTFGIENYKANFALLHKSWNK